MNQWANTHYAIFTVKTTMPLTKGTYIHCFWENILYSEKIPKSSFIQKVKMHSVKAYQGGEEVHYLMMLPFTRIIL